MSGNSWQPVTHTHAILFRGGHQKPSAPASDHNTTGSHEWQIVADSTTLTQTSDLDYADDEDDDDLDIPEFLR